MKKSFHFSGIALILLAFAALSAVSGQRNAWRTATPKELAELLPARAPVEKEHIETEISTASGVTNGHGRFIAGVVLITAGYSADGKYSHYLVVQAPVKVGGIALAPGEYVFGWQRCGECEGPLEFRKAGQMLARLARMQRFLEVRIRAVRDDRAGTVERVEVAHEVGPVAHRDHHDEHHRRQRPCCRLGEVRHAIA